MAALIILSCFLSVSLFADVPQDQFAQANAHFDKGELDQASALYDALIQKGFGGAALYYNLGNLHYRKGERGEAVLWYERALRLSPRDNDINFNLSLARSHLKDEESSIPEKIILFANANELAVVLMISLWIFFGLLGLIRLGKVSGDTWPALTLWISGFFLVSSAGWLGAHIFIDRQNAAIVIQAPGEVRNGPGDDYAVGFTVPEGSKVLILSQRPEWTQIGVPQQGLKGWIHARDVQPIIVRPAFSSS